MRKTVFMALICLTGCDKFSRSPAPSPAGAPATPLVPEKNPEKKGQESPEYVQGYEQAKARAVSEFPALGVAGSPLNAAFVARANRMKETDAPELRSSEWPYKLALKVNAELLQAKEALYRPGAVLSIADLQNMKPPPAGACVSGHITQAFGGKTADVTLDNTLKCEISEPGVGAGSAEVVWAREGNLLVLKVRAGNTNNYNVIRSFAIGQRITVEGVFTPPGTAKKLVGVVKH